MSFFLIAASAEDELLRSNHGQESGLYTLGYERCNSSIRKRKHRLLKESVRARFERRADKDADAIQIRNF